MHTRRLSNIMMATAILSAYIAGLLLDEPSEAMRLAGYLFVVYSAGIGLWLCRRRRRDREAGREGQPKA